MLSAKLCSGVGGSLLLVATVVLSLSGCSPKEKKEPVNAVPPVKTLSALPKIKVMDESTGETTRQYIEAADGQVREVVIGFKDGSRGYRYLEATAADGQPRLTSAKEVRLDGTALVFEFAADGHTPSLCTTFRKDGTKAKVSEYLEGKTLKVTSYQNDGKTKFSEETFRADRSMEKVFFQPDGVTLRATFKATGDLSIEFASYRPDGLLDYTESSPSGSTGGVTRTTITVFTSDGKLPQYRQTWVCRCGEDKGVLESLEEFFGDGKTVSRKLAFQVDLASGQGRVTGCSVEHFAEDGRKVSQKLLTADLKVLQEETLKDGQVSNTVKHLPSDGIEEKVQSDRLLEPASPNAAQLDEQLFAGLPQQRDHLKQLVRP